MAPRTYFLNETHEHVGTTVTGAVGRVIEYPRVYWLAKGASREIAAGWTDGRSHSADPFAGRRLFA